ncbi:hypothetical protein Cni_G04439 [Canna indica]|uniref:Uncharacterized protein n=1 Tax=Canna indica TaxID=4628 RepID=A0AAQ3JVD9_9LILI|nr:hypothetical protein Cni_G04439 [Canna indica]
MPIALVSAFIAVPIVSSASNSSLFPAFRSSSAIRALPASQRNRKRRRRGALFLTASAAFSAAAAAEDEEWLKKLPDKKKPLYSHSLPCIEAWLRKLGFRQSREDQAVWLVEKPDWHAQLSLDVTDLYIRYLKSGPGDLEKDIERRFSYALSREDVENAILGGP